jgi:hypothetical protein
MLKESKFPINMFNNEKPSLHLKGETNLIRIEAHPKVSMPQHSDHKQNGLALIANRKSERRRLSNQGDGSVISIRAISSYNL